MSMLFKNAGLIMPTGIYGKEVLTGGDTASDISLDGHIETPANRTIDVGGKHLSPGLTGAHSHGVGGYDFMDGNAEPIYGTCGTHLKHRTTTILPITVANTKESLLNFVDLFNMLDLQKPGCPNIYELHLGGPYFAMGQKGAQEPRYLQNPEPEEYSAVLVRTDRIKQWPFAIEFPGSGPFLAVLREQGIVSSLAHSDAICQEIPRAYENGIMVPTHFYSCIASVRRVSAFRVVGVIEAGYLLNGLCVGVIANGCHLPKELLQLVCKVKGTERICLVMDSMRVVGIPDGEHTLGGKETGMTCIKEDGVAKLPDRSVFAGSVVTSDKLARTFHRPTGALLYEAVKIASTTPAHMLDIQAKIGSIGMGRTADLIVFDKDIQASAVMVRGKLAIS